MMRVLIFIIFVASAFPANAQEDKIFCVFFDKKCLISKEIDNLNKLTGSALGIPLNREYETLLTNTFHKVLKDGDDKARRKMLDILDKFEEDKQIVQFKMALYVSLGEMTEALNILKRLQESNHYDFQDLPQHSVVIFLVDAGRAEDALQFAKETQHILFKSYGMNINMANPPLEKAMGALTKAFRKKWWVNKKYCDVLKLAAEDGAFFLGAQRSYGAYTTFPGRYCPI